MARLVAWIERISEWSGRLAAWLTLASVLILTYEVVARYLFHHPTLWAHDTSTLLFGVLYALTGAYAMYTKNHVGVDVLYVRLSPRARAAVDVATSALFFLFVGAFFWHGWRFFLVSFTRREFSLNNQYIPVYPAKFAIPAGAFLLLLQGVAKLLRDLFLVATGRELAAPEKAGAGRTPLPAPAAGPYALAEGEKPR